MAKFLINSKCIKKTVNLNIEIIMNGLKYCVYYILLNYYGSVNLKMKFFIINWLRYWRLSRNLLFKHLALVY